MSKPKILGIVNLTEDSFSDGGLYLEPERALALCKRLLEAGADILDLGAASSHPDALVVDAEEEHRRLVPVLSKLKEMGAKISVDSFLSKTQLFALSEQVDYLNDVSGFMDEEIYENLAEAKCKLVVMHSIQSAKMGSVQEDHRATRAASPDDIFSHVCVFFDQRLSALTRAGIDEKRFILDPGMGFFLGNRVQASLEVLARLDELKRRYGFPLLISVSRKSFLRSLVGRGLEEIQAAVLAAELYAIGKGVEYIRTHDPAPLLDGLKLYAALSDYD